MSDDEIKKARAEVVEAFNNCPEAQEFVMKGLKSAAQTFFPGLFGKLKEIELNNERHSTAITQEKFNQARLGLELECSHIQNERLRAEVQSIIASNQITYAKADLLRKVVNDLNLDEITPAQAFVLVKALDPNANATADFASKEYMMEQELEKMKAENRKSFYESEKKKWEADREKTQADIERDDKDNNK